jgi:hypothetical protein
MKKLAIVLAITGALSACSSTNQLDNVQQRAEQERQRQAQQIQSTIKHAPDWFVKRPKNTPDVVYGVGFGSSSNMMMAMDLAESEAYRQLCVGSGGTVDSQSKVFRSDRDGNGASVGSTAIRTRCPTVDVTGAEVVQNEVIANGNRYNYYVLVAMPLGDANSRLRAKEAIRQLRSLDSQAQSEFKELDSIRR